LPFAPGEAVEVLYIDPDECIDRDASLVSLARHMRTTMIATLDHRHFRQLAPADG
jgi:hypothetical protein